MASFNVSAHIALLGACEELLLLPATEEKSTRLSGQGPALPVQHRGRSRSRSLCNIMALAGEVPDAPPVSHEHQGSMSMLRPYS